MYETPYANNQPPSPKEKGLAIASLILAILGLFTFGVGAIIGLVLGIMALKKASKYPDQYGGRGLATGGIIVSIFSLVGLLLAAVAIPKLQTFLKQGRETAAVASIQEIHRAEASYYSRKGKYTNLNDLVTEDSLNKNYAEGKTITGYVYTTSDVSANTFTIHADRASDGDGFSDFNITEKGDVYKIENKTKGTVARGQGQLLTE